MKTFKSAELLSKVKQYDRIEEKDIAIECPSAISIYNGSIIVIDLLDSNLSYYSTKFYFKK